MGGHGPSNFEGGWAWPPPTFGLSQTSSKHIFVIASMNASYIVVLRPPTLMDDKVANSLLFSGTKRLCTP